MLSIRHIIKTVYFRIEWDEPRKVDLPFNQSLYTFPIPGSGAIMTFIINLMKGFVDYGEAESITNVQRIVESFKYGYGRRTELGDIDGINEVGNYIIFSISSTTW